MAVLERVTVVRVSNFLGIDCTEIVDVLLAARYSAVAPTVTVRPQVPTPTKLTVVPLTVHTELVEEATEKTVPLPEVLKLGVNWPP